MSDRDNDPTIPTLTQRAPARHDVPVLTETAGNDPPWDTPHRAPADPQARAAALMPHTASEAPGDAVLRAALQADIEDAVQDAMNEALHMVRARLEARLPQIVANAIRRTRLG